MKATRRGFFGMIGGAIAVALMPKPLLAIGIPVECAPIDWSYTTYLVGADALVFLPKNAKIEVTEHQRHVSYRIRIAGSVV